MTTEPSTEGDAVIARLRGVLPASWSLRHSGQERTKLVLTSPGGAQSRLHLDERRTVTPRDVETLTPAAATVLVAPWLSSRTQQALRSRGQNFVDGTGAVWLRLDEPAIFVSLPGSDRDPRPSRRKPVTLQGAMAGRLVRALVDYPTPFSLTEVSSRAGVSQSYASRQLAELDRQALIRRSPRGLVEEVSIGDLLRARSRHWDVLRSNSIATYVARTGPGDLLADIAGNDPEAVVLTGSFAATVVAPVAAPTLLLLYVRKAHDAARFADRHRLLRAERGYDVVLLTPPNGAVLERAMSTDGLTIVGYSQLVLDCLGGPGRMPAEGEALLDWMERDHHWQQPRTQVER